MQRISDDLGIRIGEDMKKTSTRTGGRRAAKIRVTSTNKPPLEATAAAFARLLVAGESKNAEIQAVRDRLSNAEKERDVWRGKNSEHYQMACALVDSLKEELQTLDGGQSTP